jgi:hypothetical protein
MNSEIWTYSLFIKHTIIKIIEGKCPLGSLKLKVHVILFLGSLSLAGSSQRIFRQTRQTSLTQINANLAPGPLNTLFDLRRWI